MLVLNEAEQQRAADVRTLSALLRYSSGLADAGPNDMQMLLGTPLGVEPPARGLAMLGVSAMRVFSRGRLSLGPAMSVAAPMVEFRMLSDERDRARLRDGFARAIDLVRHPAVADLTMTVLAGQTPLDGKHSEFPSVGLSCGGPRVGWAA